MYFLLFIINNFLDLAKLPQSINITGLFLLSKILITLSVNLCHPISLCDKGLFLSTVKILFKRMTPSLAQSSKFPGLVL